MPSIPKLISTQQPPWYKQHWKNKGLIREQTGCLIALHVVTESSFEIKLQTGDYKNAYVDASNARLTADAFDQFKKWNARLQESKQPRSRFMKWRNISVNENYIGNRHEEICPNHRITPMFLLMCGFPEYTEHNVLTIYLMAYAAANATSLGRNYFAEDFVGIPDFEGRLLMPNRDLFEILKQHPESIIPQSFIAPTIPPAQFTETVQLSGWRTI